MLFWERGKGIILDQFSKVPCKPEIQGKEKQILVLINTKNLPVGTSAFKKGIKGYLCTKQNKSIKFSLVLTKNEGKEDTIQTCYLLKVGHLFQSF